jgi:hypothetical protein
MIDCPSPDGSGILFCYEKPLDCARGDKQKRYSGQLESAPHEQSELAKQIKKPIQLRMGFFYIIIQKIIL